MQLSLRPTVMHSQTSRVILAFSISALVLSFSPVASADTVLNFRDAAGNPLPNDALVPQDYGDNVAAGIQGSYSYGQAEAGSGFTPNITTAYSQPGDLSTYTGGYGDLTTVLYSSNDYTITFTATDGFSVNLQSFNTAAYEANDEVFNVSVSNGINPPFTLSNVIAPANGHANISFAGQAAAIGQTVTLTFDVPNFNVGITDVQFSQVPEPSSAIFVGLASVGLIGSVRRRKA